MLLAIMMRFKAMYYPTKWEFKDPDTGTQFVAKTRESLKQHIVAYRSQNQLLPIESLDVILENYLCMIPANEGGCMPMQLKRGLMVYLHGGMALLKNVIFDRIVGLTEANRRAEICITCPHNVFPDKDGFIAWADKMAEIQVKGQRSTHHDELGNCAVCTCPLRVKVSVAPPFNLPEDQVITIRKSKPNCWQLPENEYKDRSDVSA